MSQRANVLSKVISVLVLMGCLNTARAAQWREAAPEKGVSLFVPVSIDEYCNTNRLKDGMGLANESLPSSKDAVYVDGIPFRFSGNNNHIDVGQSLFESRNGQMCFKAIKNWSGLKDKKEGRIQLALPYHAYKTLWVIAASDGDENNIPVFSAVFYRPEAGFPKIFKSEAVPLFSDKRAKKVKSLPVRLADHKKANLWLVKVPLNPGELSDFSDLDTMELELTKEVKPWRSYPDPISYSFFQAGLPSGVHIYALTLEKPAIDMEFEPLNFAHVFTSPEKPGYKVILKNRWDKPQDVTLRLQTTSHNGKENLSQEKCFTLNPNQEWVQEFVFSPRLLGYHKIKATLFYADQERVEERSFAHLAPDNREREWNGQGFLFSYWGFDGKHHSPSADQTADVMYRAGARAGSSYGVPGLEKYSKILRVRASPWLIKKSLPAFSKKTDFTEEECRDFGQSMIEKMRKNRDLYMREGRVYLFPEPHIGTFSSSIPPMYYGEPEYKFTEKEKEKARSYINTGVCAVKTIRNEFPDFKILLPWGDPGFMIALLRQGYPPELFDGVAVDIPGFERLPEQQLRQISLHRLWLLKQEFKRFGCEDKELDFVEGMSVPVGPGACTQDEQKDRYIRSNLLYMAYGVKRFYGGVGAFSAGNWYGSEHYGRAAALNRIPYCNPFPLYTAYATMTDILEGAEFDQWLPTGSLNTYCLRFNRPRGPVYALWTLRGKRDVELNIEQASLVKVTDSQNNSHPLDVNDYNVTVEVSTSPVWVTGIDKIMDMKPGKPVYSEKPAENHTVLDDFSKKHWCYDPGRDLSYENNHWDTKRFASLLDVSYASSDEQNASVLQVELEEPEKDPKVMPLYGKIVPDEPFVIPGKASALGLWVKGNGSWGRVIYTLRDAKGELWRNIGVKDQWNCDDIHAWSFFNFDGWRYMSFPLPAHSAYDSFRELGTTWWNSEGGDEVVDLPLTLENMIVEMRTHVIYVNDIEKVPYPNVIQLTGLIAEYNNKEDMSGEAIAKNRIRMESEVVAVLEVNPIDQLRTTGAANAVNIEKVEHPEWGYDGTRGHVYFKEVPTAKEYQIWVSTFPDGRDAVVKARFHKSGELLQGLRAGKKSYLYLTYTDAHGKCSKPSKAFPVELKDEFGMK